MFNEKEKEYSRKQGKEIPVYQSPKYQEAKAKAIELIDSKKYDLSEGDFWILMNETKSGKMQYTGLIISHNGCLKINDKLENKFKTDRVTLDKEGYNSSLVYTYIDEDVYEIGEVSSKNCQNDYPYAMAFKRCFDRVVLKKSKLAYAGVYSDSEADEFRAKDLDNEVPNDRITQAQADALKMYIQTRYLAVDFVNNVLQENGFEKIEDITRNKYATIVKTLKGAVENGA